MFVLYSIYLVAQQAQIPLPLPTDLQNQRTQNEVTY